MVKALIAVFVVSFLVACAFEGVGMLCFGGVCVLLSGVVLSVS